MKHLSVSIENQSIVLTDSHSETVFETDVSTSKFGEGSEEGSYKTPLGSFRVCEKYGSRANLNTIFKGRKPVGEWNEDEEVDEDLVLTRIIRLEGLGDDNSNTYERYIYLHGTNQEDLIGSRASHGCIRLRNEDMRKLYPLLSVGTPVTIL